MHVKFAHIYLQLIKAHTTSTGEQREREGAQASAKVDPVRIWIRIDFNFDGTSLSKDTYLIKFRWRPGRFFQSMRQTVENCLRPTCNVEASFKKFLALDPAVDDFQNLMVSSLSKDTSLVKFSWRSDQQFYVKLLIDIRQTDRQTPGITWRSTMCLKKRGVEFLQ